MNSESWQAGFWVRAGAQAIDLGLIFSVGLADNYRHSGSSLSLYLALPYYWVLTGWRGQTLGKMAAGIRVVRRDGGPVGWGRSLGRALAYLLSILSAGLGFLAAAVTPGKRALHDYVAGTQVIPLPGIGRMRSAAVAACAFLVPVACIAGIGSLMAIDPKNISPVTAGTLSSLRSSESIYYGDRESHPARLTDLMPKYLEQINELRLPNHRRTREVRYYGGEVCTGTAKEHGIDPSKLDDSGKWGYVADPKSPCWGTVFIDCTHADYRGTAWYQY